MTTLRQTGIALALAVLWACAAAGQLTSQDIAALREEGKAKGWTFSVGECRATQRPLEELCGFRVTDENLQRMPKLLPGATVPPKGAKDLPAALDWRALGGVTPVKDQGPCGSCWAFAMVGAFESAILINDGVEVDLSEQWLVSCNLFGFGCSGSIFIFDYFVDLPDLCGQSGAVLEADFPYVAYEAECVCPHPHQYWINTYGSAGWEIDEIKQSILDYGPVGVSIITNSAFHAYSSGVFNECAEGTVYDVTHAVVLVGWDDALGTEGCWILKNSWDVDWGEDGYMHIEYECSQVGAFAAYVDYGTDMNISHDKSLYATGEIGGPFSPASEQFIIENSSASALEWTAGPSEDWVRVSPDSGLLDPYASVPVTVAINENAGSQPVGLHSATIWFDDVTNGVTQWRYVSLTVNQSAAYSFPMDGDPGWTAEGQWAFGQPTGNGSHNPDPTSGYTGANVYGYNLDGDYEDDMTEMCLTTTPFDCWNLSNVTLSFWRWLGVEGATYDHAKVQVSNNGTSWTTVWENSGTVQEEAWTLCQYDISATADHQPAVYLRWTMGPTDTSWTFSGWNIDDVVISGTGESAFTFTQVPHGATLMEGDPLVLSVEVEGTVGEVTYQWIKDGVALAEENFYAYHVESVTVDDAGWYCCRVWDESKGVRTTDPVHVQVYPEGALPAAAFGGLCLAALACLAAGAFAIARKRR